LRFWGRINTEILRRVSQICWRGGTKFLPS
jgi:hypothetical protein